MSFTDQTGYDVRLECGRQGLQALASAALDTIVIVDVLSFSTSVSVAVERGALVFPYPQRKDGLETYAAERQAVVAGSRWDVSVRFSLSPSSMEQAAPGDRIVLPSPNGASLSFEAARYGNVFAGCLRNCSAVAQFLSRGKSGIAVIAAGERWQNGALRVSFEDLLGAGSIVAALPGTRSPEAEGAAAMFEHFRQRLPDALQSCSSGRELVGRGFGADVRIAAELDASDVVPMLVDGGYSNARVRSHGHGQR